MPPTIPPTPPTRSDGIQEYRRDIQTRFESAGQKIESFWRSFTSDQRLACMRATVHTKDKLRILRHDKDTGPTYKLMPLYLVMPDWNLADVVESGPEYFLGLLKHRAMTTLSHQFWKGPNDRPGDYALIFKNMTVNHLKHPDADVFEKSGTNVTFQEGKNYGQPFVRSKELLSSFRPSFPQHVGELVLFRQFRLLEGIHRLMDRILEEGAKIDTGMNSPASTAAVMSKLPTISQPTVSPSTISSLACRAQDEMEWLERKQDAIMTEPELLADAVQTWFDTRPGLVANEKGETWPLHTDKHIGPAFFDVHRDATTSAVISAYLAHLLQLLEETDASKRILRSIILKEIGEICHMEFDRAQSSLKRQIQRGLGKRWFKRVNRVTDLGGDAGVVAKVQPEELTRTDPQMHYLLRLCHPDTDISLAVQWLENIGNLYEAAPSERDRLTEAGFEALCNMAHVVGFQNDIRTLLPPRQPSAHRQWRFFTKMGELDATMTSIRDQLDLRDIAFPISNLRESAAAERAVARMDGWVREKVGKSMKAAYEGLVQECLLELEERYKELKASSTTPTALTTSSTFGPEAVPSKGTRQSASSKGKEKTRSRQPPSTEAQPAQPADAPEPRQPSPIVFKVRSGTAEVFAEIFDKSNVQAPVNWSKFQSAMVDLGFSVEPRFGSVFTFSPSTELGVTKSFTIHRPHSSKMERYLLQYVARRLNRLYGWTRDTFELT